MAIKQTLTAIGGVLGAAVLIAGPAAAQGYGHGGHYVEHKPAHVCYEHVTTPEVYGTVKKQVVVKEGVWETKDIAAITKIIDKKILVKAGEWETKTTPAVFEAREKQVLVEPAKVIWHVTPPVFKTERVSKPVETGYGHKENAVLTFDKQVLVEPAKKHAEHKPAIYKTVKFNVLVTPEHHEKIWHPPVFETKQEEVEGREGADQGGACLQAPDLEGVRREVLTSMVELAAVPGIHGRQSPIFGTRRGVLRGAPLPFVRLFHNWRDNMRRAPAPYVMT
jgi:hypothetical protein